MYDSLLFVMREKRPFDELQFKADFTDRFLNTLDEGKAQRLFPLYVKERLRTTRLWMS